MVNRQEQRPYRELIPLKDLEEFSTREKEMLRPIAETLAMLDGNAFFTMSTNSGKEWYEQYIPEAHRLYESNGGDNGWAGEASFIKRFKNGQ